MSAALNFHQLRLFHAVAKLGSISRAARELRISQPSVSAQMQEFEQRCGVDLLRRLPRGVALTDAGRMIFEHADRLFALADELQATLRDLRRVQSGELTIGGSLTAGEYFLPVVMKFFKKHHPAVEPVLVLDNSTTILDRIERRELDFGFVGTDAVGARLNAVPCWKDELVVIAAPGSLPPARRRLPISSLQSRPFVMREPGSATRIRAEQCLQTHRVTLDTTMIASSPEAVKRHVAMGLGWGFASKHSVATEVAAGQLVIVPIAGWDCHRSFCAVHRRDHRLSLSQQKFLEAAQNLETELAATESDQGAQAMPPTHLFRIKK